jgi:hypothetical protein
MVPGLIIGGLFLLGFAVSAFVLWRRCVRPGLQRKFGRGGQVQQAPRQAPDLEAQSMWFHLGQTAPAQAFPPQQNFPPQAFPQQAVGRTGPGGWQGEAVPELKIPRPAYIGRAQEVF